MALARVWLCAANQSPRRSAHRRDRGMAQPPSRPPVLVLSDSVGSRVRSDNSDRLAHTPPRTGPLPFLRLRPPRHTGAAPGVRTGRQPRCLRGNGMGTRLLTSLCLLLCFVLVSLIAGAHFSARKDPLIFFTSIATSKARSEEKGLSAGRNDLGDDGSVDGAHGQSSLGRSSSRKYVAKGRHRVLSAPPPARASAPPARGRRSGAWRPGRRRE